MSDQIQPGWYQDPEELPRQRYWGGKSWTSDTRPMILKSEQIPLKPKRSGLDEKEAVLLIFIGFLVLFLIMWDSL
jgi:hypothetical protein